MWTYIDESYYFASADGLKDRSGKNLQIFPVLTISTNTDKDRPLRADSFIILRFDKKWGNDETESPFKTDQINIINDLIWFINVRSHT